MFNIINKANRIFCGEIGNNRNVGLREIDFDDEEGVELLEVRVVRAVPSEVVSSFLYGIYSCRNYCFVEMQHFDIGFVKSATYSAHARP
jgi:hypothetical protein